MLHLKKIDFAILKYRKKRRISQSDFAKKVGVKQATVSNWESKKVKPSGENLERIRELLASELPEEKPTIYGNELILLRKLLAAKDEIIEHLKDRLNALNKGQL